MEETHETGRESSWRAVWGIAWRSTRGGIPTLTRNGVNGVMFSLRTPAEDCARWIAELHSDRIRYAALVRTSFEEYQERLNWRISGATVMRYLTTLCGFGQDA